MPTYSGYQAPIIPARFGTAIPNPGGDFSGASPQAGGGLLANPGTTAGLNLQGFPNIASLTDQINQLNRTAQGQANVARIPDAANLESKSSANIGAELSGQLPQDVIAQLNQRAAERGVAIGSPDSANAGAAYLRALGLNSLQQQQVGQQNLSAAYARNPAAPIFDPSQLLLTPYQAGSLDVQQARNAIGLFGDLMRGGLPAYQGPGAQGYNYFDPTINTTSGSRGALPDNGLFPTTPTYNPDYMPDYSASSRTPGYFDTPSVNYSGYA